MSSIPFQMRLAARHRRARSKQHPPTVRGLCGARSRPAAGSDQAGIELGGQRAADEIGRMIEADLPKLVPADGSQS